MTKALASKFAAKLQIFFRIDIKNQEKIVDFVLIRPKMSNNP